MTAMLRRESLPTVGIDDVRHAEALFASQLQPSTDPSNDTVRQVVLATEARLDAGACACLVAQEFGEHPDCAPGRMRWAIDEVAKVYHGPAVA